MAFVMNVDDVFKFSDGRTIFLGSVDEGAPDPIPRLACDLIIDGEETQLVMIDGEEIAERREEARAHLRAVGTSENVSLTSEFVRSHRCLLREHPS